MQQGATGVHRPDRGNQSGPQALEPQVRSEPGRHLVENRVGVSGQPAAQGVVNAPQRGIHQERIAQSLTPEFVDPDARTLEVEESQVPREGVQEIVGGILVPELVVHIIHMIGIAHHEQGREERGEVGGVHHGHEVPMSVRRRSAEPFQQIEDAGGRGTRGSIVHRDPVPDVGILEETAGKPLVVLAPFRRIAAIDVAGHPSLPAEHRFVGHLDHPVQPGKALVHENRHELLMGPGEPEGLRDARRQKLWDGVLRREAQSAVAPLKILPGGPHREAHLGAQPMDAVVAPLAQPDRIEPSLMHHRGVGPGVESGLRVAGQGAPLVGREDEIEQRGVVLVRLQVAIGAHQRQGVPHDREAGPELPRHAARAGPEVVEVERRGEGGQGLQHEVSPHHHRRGGQQEHVDEPKSPPPRCPASREPVSRKPAHAGTSMRSATAWSGTTTTRDAARRTPSGSSRLR